MGRFDDIGMFWEDVPVERGKNRIRPQPPIPDTGWTPPVDFPNLSSASVLAVDTETYDPELEEHGPGWARGVGHIVGVSIGAMDSSGRIDKWYFPMRHEIEPEMNMDPDKVLAWLRDALSDPSQPKVGANLTYDVGWLKQEGVEVRGELVDVQFAEALLHETARVALEILGQKYLGEGKESNILYQWCSDFYGGAVTGKQRANIYRSPPRLTGPYAESDADLPLRLAKVMYPLLKAEGQLDLFKMENELIPLMVEMRFAGVHVNIPDAERVSDELGLYVDKQQKKLDYLAGGEVNVNARDSISPVFDALGIPYNRTKKGNASFPKKYLEGVNHPVAELILDIRKTAKIKGTFVESYILNSHINEMVYGQFHQMRGDDGGTRSGRFSSSTPNLQNIPSRDDILAPLVRGMFIPDYGHKCWRKYDYSQIEYRLLIAFAVGQAGVDVRQFFNENPDTDYHVYAQDVIQQLTGRYIERKPIKNINFGLIYGMGIDALAQTLGLSKKDTKTLIEAYFKGVPFAKPTMDAAMAEAQDTGIITTILNRKSRFDLWEPTKWGKDTIALPYEQALLKYGNIRRAYGHKGLNRKLQGSAADIMKLAMHKCYYDGVFDRIGVPRLTVHDELDFSDPGGVDDGFREMRHILETAIDVGVPLKAEGEFGPDWGHAKQKCI